MVQAGRVVCITAPFLLSLAALITLVLIFLAGTMEKNNTTGDLFFVNIDLQNLTTAAAANVASSTGSNALSTIGTALETAKTTIGMKDHYTIYLRNYCSWNEGDDKYANCTEPTSYFWFNPVSVWALNSTSLPIESLLPEEFRTGLSAYHSGSKAMFILYCAALAANCFTILIGFTAIFSRWGSFFTTFFAAAQSIAFLGASVVATAMFIILRTVLNNELEDDYSVVTTLGNRSLVTSWIGTAFALGAGFFWFLSVCCCSGRSPYNKNRDRDGGRSRTRAEKTPYTYERVGSPYHQGQGPHPGQQSVPLGAYGAHNSAPMQQGNAYEPYRSQV